MSAAQNGVSPLFGTGLRVLGRSGRTVVTVTGPARFPAPLRAPGRMRLFRRRGAFRSVSVFSGTRPEFLFRTAGHARNPGAGRTGKAGSSVRTCGADFRFPKVFGFSFAAIGSRVSEGRPGTEPRNMRIER